MKRILSILLAMGLIVGLSTAVYAQDDLVSFSGTMRVLGFYDENYADFDDGNDLDENEFWWQRFRLYTKFTPAEGVSAHLRTDFSERNWGSDASAVGRPAIGFETLHIDRAFLEIAKEMFSFRAGQQYTAWGVTAAFDPQFTGYLLNLKFPVTVDLIYGKVDEGTGTSDDEEDVDDDGVLDAADGDYDTEDETFYGLQVGYASETFTVKSFFAASEDDGNFNRDDDMNVFGLWTKMNFGMFDLAAELDVFGGDDDNGAAEMDYVGTQFYLGVGMKFSDAFRLGVDFVFAEGTDEGDAAANGIIQAGDETATTPDEIQITELYTFGDFMPQTLPPLDADYNILPGDIFEPWENAGIIGLIVEAEFAATDALKFYAQMAYAEPEEEDIEGRTYDKLWDDVWWVQAGLQWNFMEAASLIFVGHYTQIGFDGDDDHPANARAQAADDSDVDDDAAWGVITEVRVTF